MLFIYEIMMKLDISQQKNGLNGTFNISFNKGIEKTTVGKSAHWHLL